MKDAVQIASGTYGAARRYGGDIVGAQQVLDTARLEKHIRKVAASLTPEQRAHLITVIITPDSVAA